MDSLLFNSSLSKLGLHTLNPIPHGIFFSWLPRGGGGILPPRWSHPKNMQLKNKLQSKLILLIIDHQSRSTYNQFIDKYGLKTTFSAPDKVIWTQTIKIIIFLVIRSFLMFQKIQGQKILQTQCIYCFDHILFKFIHNFHFK